MLKLVALPIVNQIACTRDVLREKLARLERGELKVLIGFGQPEDDEVLRQIKPVMQRILRERIASLENDLETYGVDIA